MKRAGEQFISLLNDVKYRAGPPSSLRIYAPVLRQCIRLFNPLELSGTEVQDHNAEWILIPTEASGTRERNCCSDPTCRHFMLLDIRKKLVGMVEFDCIEDVEVEHR